MRRFALLAAGYGRPREYIGVQMAGTKNTTRTTTSPVGDPFPFGRASEGLDPQWSPTFSHYPTPRQFCTMSLRVRLGWLRDAYREVALFVPWLWWLTPAVIVGRLFYLWDVEILRGLWRLYSAPRHR